MSADRPQGLDEAAVVIPSRNRWPLLRTALAGALAQRDVEVHVVVVDDGSTDATRHQLEGLSHPRLTIVRNDHAEGVSAARNRGLRAVTAPWVAFLDDDDVWAPDHLATMLAAVRRSGRDPERVGLVFARQLVVDGDRYATGLEPMVAEDGVREHLSLYNPLGGPSMVLLRTDVVRAAGGFDERLSIVADWDLWARIVTKHEVVRSPESAVAYMRHADSMHLDIERLLGEFAALREKDQWAPGGLSDTLSDRGRLLHLASTYRLCGRRFRAARCFLRSFVAHHVWRDLARAGAVIVGGRVVRLSRLGQRMPPVDPSLRAWLREVRAAEAATDGLPQLQGIHQSYAPVTR